MHHYLTFDDFYKNYLIDFDKIKESYTYLEYLNELLNLYDYENYVELDKLHESMKFIESDDFDVYSQLISKRNNKYLSEEIYLSLLAAVNINSNVEQLAPELINKYNITDHTTIELIRHWYNDLKIQKEKLLLFNLESEKINHEFDRIKDFLKHEIELQNRSLKFEIDPTDSTNQEKIILLNELGILDVIAANLNDPENIRSLSNVISFITGIKLQTVNSYITPIRNTYNVQKNNPYKNKDNIKGLKQKLEDLKINFTNNLLI